MTETPGRVSFEVSGTGWKSQRTHPIHRAVETFVRRAPPAAARSNRFEDPLANAEIKVESQHLTELTEQKEELMGKVQTLKKELQDWRSKLDGQVQSYRGEITELRKTLNGEVDALRNEFMDLKTALKQQLELTAGLAAQNDDVSG
eukprot:gene30512-35539_t